MMRTLVSALTLLLACVAASAHAQPTDFGFNDPTRRLQLVDGLKEISGLAVASENTVYAHNDEYGIVYEINLEDGAVASVFALGDPTVKADFEGVAAAEGRIFLVTSTGLIFETLRGGHRERVRYNIYDTGAGEFCEIEGITSAPARGEFLLMCKTPHKTALNGRLVVFKWSLVNRTPVSTPWLDISLAELLTARERRNFRPSAIEWRARDDMLIMLSARSHLLLALRRDGTLIAKKELPVKVHPQAEGVAIMPSGDLVIADEGVGRLPGVLTIYEASD